MHTVKFHIFIAIKVHNTLTVLLCMTSYLTDLWNNDLCIYKREGGA